VLTSFATIMATAGIALACLAAYVAYRRDARMGWSLAVLLLAGFAGVCRTSERPSRAGLPEWLKVPLQMIDPEDPPPPRPVRMLGKIACPPPPPAKAPAPTVGP
jgi:hypothetical protein